MKPVLFTIEPFDNNKLLALCGNYDNNIRHLEQKLAVSIHNRANSFYIYGPSTKSKLTQQVLQTLYEIVHQGAHLTHHTIDETIDNIKQGSCKTSQQKHHIITEKVNIVLRNKHQIDYVKSLKKYDVNFAIGPSGTGKTFLGAAVAVESLERQMIQRIILVRPAVEAGEKLGFLPGDLTQKIDPYLRPLFDALNELLHRQHIIKLIERNIIEIAPLAYMRGRTLNNAMVLLDEAQNTTPEQLKMFLTRLGHSAKAIITGDLTQIDLAQHQPSGLVQAIEVLEEINDIKFNYFNASDVQRHPLVEQIVRAYDVYHSKKKPVKRAC